MPICSITDCQLERRIWSVWGQNRSRKHCWESSAGPQPCVHDKKPFIDGGETKSVDSLADSTLTKPYWRGKREGELSSRVINRCLESKEERRRHSAERKEEKWNWWWLLFFLVYWTVCWFIGLLFRVLEKKKKKRKEKQRKNGTVNCFVLICLVFKIITVKK